MLRLSGTLLVGLLMAVALSTLAAAQSPSADWGFEAGGAGWRVSNAAFALATPAHGGASAGRLTAFNTEPMRIVTLQPLEGAPADSVATASVWVLANPGEVARVTLQLEAFTEGLTVLARREAVAPLGGAFAPVEVSLVLPPGAAFGELSVVAVPLHEGARILVDSTDLTIAATSVATPTPTSMATVTPTPTASPTSTRTPTSTPTSTPVSTRTPTASPTPVATPAVFPSLTNGDFEDPRGLYGWSAQGGVAASVVRSSGYAASLSSASPSTKWLQQGIGVAPGGWFRASAWLRATEGSDAWLRIAWYASDDASGGQVAVVDSPFADPHGEVVSVEVRAPLDARSARIRLMLRPASSAPATLEADDVRFEAGSPPLPATPSATAAATVAALAAAGPPVAGPSPESLTRAPAAAPSRGADAGPGLVGASAVTALDRNVQPASLRLLRITELLPDPIEPGPDADFEWIEVANLGTAAESLAGFTLQDNGGTLELPPIEVPAGAALVLRAARADTGRAVLVHTLDRGISNGLGNAGDRVALRSPEGDIVDAVSWGSDRTYALGLPELPAPTAGRSILRRFNDDGSFVDAIESAQPSPGDWLDSRALPADHAPAHLAALDQPADRGWPLLLAIAGAALALAGADRVRRVLQAR